MVQGSDRTERASQGTAGSAGTGGPNNSNNRNKIKKNSKYLVLILFLVTLVGLNVWSRPAGQPIHENINEIVSQLFRIHLGVPTLPRIGQVSGSVDGGGGGEGSGTTTRKTLTTSVLRPQ